MIESRSFVSLHALGRKWLYNILCAGNQLAINMAGAQGGTLCGLSLVLRA